MGTYISQSDVEAQFGVTNVNDWADIDNDGNATTISNRISTAISYGEGMFEGRLRTSRHDVPYSDTTDQLVKSICAIYAGEYLYRSRGLRDIDETNRLKAVVDRADQIMRMIITGQIKLTGKLAMSEGGPTCPVVII